MGAWTVGHNLAGYLPESDVWAFVEWQDAADMYVAEVQRYADEDDEMAAEDMTEDEWQAEPPAMRATVDAILSDPSFPLENGKPYGMVIEDGRGRMISLWLDWSDEDPPEDDGWLA